MTEVIEKVAWVRLENGRILVVRSRGKDAYYLPGGKPEPGEGAHESLIREAREELGVELLPGSITPTVTVQAPAHGEPAGTIVRIACHTADYRGVPAPHSETAELAWLTHGDRHRVSQAARIVLDLLAADGRLRGG
ncbi:NUDIX domain-containing protein [Streptomyces sp. V1I1]|uniref:NUDIX hydrolase n=1 Tax=Streptomyces sp. V1I1 TaxID=3042272 RepID=UPI00277D791D|nr:NUDIX domain-containing protein [Streptomyces sp. V1I1]MDQ0939046.1 8-oxo-dGTP diphosphatase [Streptomyces sp. V1I1]